MRILAIFLLAAVATAGEPLLTLDYRGGFGPVPLTKEPYVRVQPDGTVEVPDRAGKAPDLVMKIDKAEVEELRKLGQAVADFDADAVLRKIRAAQGAVVQAIVDAPDTVVTFKGRSARYNALSYWAIAYPQIKELAALHRLEKRLAQLMHFTRAGGKEKAAAALKLLNAELLKKHPQAKPLALEHLRNVGIAQDGARSLYFYRSEPRGQTGGRVTFSAKGETSVVVESAG